MARRRLSPRERERRQQNFKMIAMSMGILVVLGLFGLGWRMSRERNLERDARLCPQVAGPSFVHVVLVDGTDAYNAVQRSSLRRALLDFKSMTPKDGLLAVYVVSEIDRELPAPKFEGCNPGDPRDASPWIENPVRVRQRWDEQFGKPLDTLFEELLALPALDQSPIMEMVQGVAISTLQGVDVERRLTLVSDLLQNTPVFSIYRSAPTHVGSQEEKAMRWKNLFDTFRESPVFKRLWADLSGVDVELLYIRRDGAEALQGGQLVQFWDRYFSALGGRVQRVKQIEG